MVSHYYLLAIAFSWYQVITSRLSRHKFQLQFSCFCLIFHDVLDTKESKSDSIQNILIANRNLNRNSATQLRKPKLCYFGRGGKTGFDEMFYNFFLPFMPCFYRSVTIVRKNTLSCTNSFFSSFDTVLMREPKINKYLFIFNCRQRLRQQLQCCHLQNQQMPHRFGTARWSRICQKIHRHPRHSRSRHNMPVNNNNQ